MNATNPTLSAPDAERELMMRALQGEADAYGQLFERCHPRIYRMAYAMLHDSTSADDAAQEAFVKGFDKIGSYRGEAPPSVWFASIVINICRHRLREGKHQESGATERTLEAGRVLFRPRTRAAASKAVIAENYRMLAIALGFLTEAQREAFLLHYDQGLSYDHVGEILGVRPGAARALAHRAKAGLRGRLSSEEWISQNLPHADD